MRLHAKIRNIRRGEAPGIIDARRAKACELAENAREFFDRRENFEEVVKEAREAQRLDDHLDDAYALEAAALYVGIHYRLQQEAPKTLCKAQKAAARALRLNPKNPLALATLGGVRESLHRALDQALECYDKALKREPANAEALQWQAFCIAEMQGDYQKGLEAMKQTLDLDPASPALVLGLGRLYIGAGDFDTAADMLEGAGKNGWEGQLEARRLLGLALAHAGDRTFDRAIKLLRQARHLDDNPLYDAWEALIRARAGDKEKALQALKKARHGRKTLWVPSPSIVAAVYRELRDAQRWEWWFRIADGCRDPWLPFVLRVLKAWDREELRPYLELVGMN